VLFWDKKISFHKAFSPRLFVHSMPISRFSRSS
jgi:hypothetical protein